MDERPDSALQMLQGIDTTALGNSEEMRALYALLMSQALESNDINVDNDSLISIAVNYYADSDDTYHRMKAHLYQGIVKYYAQNYPASLIACLEAKADAEALNDKYWLGRVARGLVVVFNHTYNNAEELRYSQMAYDCFKETDRADLYRWAIYELALSYHNISYYDNSVEFATQALDEAIEHNDSSLARASIRQLGKSNFAMLNYDEALKAYKHLCAEYTVSIEDSAFLALSYQRCGDTKNANEIFSAISSYSGGIISWAQCEILMAEKDTVRAFGALNNLYKKQNATLMSVIRQNMNGVISDYYHSKGKIKEAELQASRLTSLIIILISIIVVGIAVCLWYIQHKKAQQHKKIASNLRDFLDIKEQECSQAEQTIRNLLHNKFKELDRLCQLYDSTGNNKMLKPQILKEAERLLAGLSLNGSTIAELESEVNLCSSNLMHDLRNDLPDMKEEDYKLYLYTLLGFSSAAISLLLNVNDVTKIYSRKKRLKIKIYALPTDKRSRYEKFF